MKGRAGERPSAHLMPGVEHRLRQQLQGATDPGSLGAQVLKSTVLDATDAPSTVAGASRPPTDKLISGPAVGDQNASKRAAAPGGSLDGGRDELPEYCASCASSSRARASSAAIVRCRASMIACCLRTSASSCSISSSRQSLATPQPYRPITPPQPPPVRLAPHRPPRPALPPRPVNAYVIFSGARETPPARSRGSLAGAQ